MGARRFGADDARLFIGRTDVYNRPVTPETMAYSTKSIGIARQESRPDSSVPPYHCGDGYTYVCVLSYGGANNPKPLLNRRTQPSRAPHAQTRHPTSSRAGATAEPFSAADPSSSTLAKYYHIFRTTPVSEETSPAFCLKNPCTMGEPYTCSPFKRIASL